MSGQQSLYSAPAYSPNSVGQPSPGPYPPPAKRQRLSPNLQSPYTSPHIANGSLPNQLFGNPNLGDHVNGLNAKIEPDTPQTPQYAGLMGPPQRPQSEAKLTDVNQLSDVLTGADIDIRAEEALLAQQSEPSRAYSSPSFGSHLLSSFGGPPRPYSFSPHGSQVTFAQNEPGDRKSFYGAGTFNQPARADERGPDEILEDQRARARRILSERQQHHQNDPFLEGKLVYEKISRKTAEYRIGWPSAGVFVPQDARRMAMMIAGPDGHEILTALEGQPLLNSDADMQVLLSLLSLACRDYLRTIIEDAAAIAVGRRASANGIVPADLVDVASGQGVPEVRNEAQVNGGSDLSSPQPLRKRSMADINGDDTAAAAPAVPSLTVVTYPNLVARALQKIVTNENAAEEARMAKRRRRLNSPMEPGEESRLSSVAASMPGTPGPVEDKAPEPDKKKAKKEQQKAARMSIAASSSGGSMIRTALGGAKSVSWLNRPAPASTGFPVPPRSQNISQSKPGAAAPKAAETRQFGRFREDRVEGNNVQLRDLVHTMEDSMGKERKTLAKAYRLMKQ